MLSVVACACGMDPATEGMLVQVALAGVISVPIFFREQAYKLVRRLRGQSGRSEESCPIAAEPDHEA